MDREDEEVVLHLHLSLQIVFVPVIEAVEVAESIPYVGYRNSTASHALMFVVEAKGVPELRGEVERQMLLSGSGAFTLNSPGAG